VSFQATISRVVKCTPERAYDLWTKPELISQWFCPKEMPSEVTLDPKVGGVFRFVVHYKPDDSFGCTCHIRAMERPKRFAFSWRWDESSFDQGVSEVEVLFDAIPGGTAITLTHTKMQNDASVERHSIGWTELLNRFENQVNKALEEIK
jgi:uncharacterized protein YndB with AHSA1/START domain